MQKALWLFLLAVVHAAIAQDCTRAVPINVLTYQTHQPVSFQPEQLHGTLEGKSLTISHLEKIKGNRIVVLIDTSASMEKKLPFAKAALQVLIENFPSGSSVAYGFFGEEQQLTRSFTTDSKQFGQALQELNRYKAAGGTPLRDALHQGLRLFKPAYPGDSVLLITDGGENQSALQESAIEKELRTSGVRVFAIVPLVAPQAMTLPEEEFGPSWLTSVAEKTGGRVFAVYHDWPYMDKKWLQQVGAMLQNFWLNGVAGGYLLNVELPGSLTKPANLKIRINTSGDKHLRDTSVIYPQKLMPCRITAATAH